jgi:DNA-binding response OmpR family regulator
MHILYVEDEAKMAEFFQAGLKEQGFFCGLLWQRE